MNKNFFLIVLALFTTVIGFSQEVFHTVWNTKTDLANRTKTITLPLVPHGVYDFEVDWGDGSSLEYVDSYQEVSHEYSERSYGHDVKITGLLNGWSFGMSEYGIDSLKIEEVVTWGDLKLGATKYQFKSCKYMKVTATDILDLSATTSLEGMFNRCYDLSIVPSINSWDMSTITSTKLMFGNAQSFNDDLSGFDVSNVTDMRSMFNRAYAFNQDISSWDVSNVEDMSYMFRHAHSYNQPLNTWVTSSLNDIKYMFEHAHKFNQDLDNWNTSQVTSLLGVFMYAYDFNGQVNTWDTTNNETLEYTFAGATSFNQPLDAWNTTNVTNMHSTFNSAESFNQDISSWNVLQVTNMYATFRKAFAFNQPLNDWDTDNVTTMYGMFEDADVFNQSLYDWNTISVTDMGTMFKNANVFNQDISGWNTTNVTAFNQMFMDAVNFEQNIGSWIIGNVTNMHQMFKGVTLDYQTLEAILAGWVSQVPNIDHYTRFHPGEGTICDTTNFDWLDVKEGWDMQKYPDADPSCNGNPFITVWETTTPNEIFSLPLNNTGVYDFYIDWGDGSPQQHVLGSYISHLYADVRDDYVVTITGQIEGFGTGGNIYKLQEVRQWGNVKLSNAGGSSNGGVFEGCTDLVITATDILDTSNLTNMSFMFYDCSSLTTVPNMEYWDTSNVTDMMNMFRKATNFNQPINNWDVSKVEITAGMFNGASNFNQPLDNWDVSSLKIAEQMFSNTLQFNQPLDSWNMSNVETIRGMFFNAKGFNQPLNSWDVSNVSDMYVSFWGAENFNQSLSNWNIESVTNMHSLLMDTSLSVENYDATLIGWSSLDLGETSIPLNVLFSTNASYCLGEEERSTLIDDYGWIISDGGLNCSMLKGEITLSSSEFIIEELSIFPNPASDLIVITGISDATITVFDTSGQVVISVSEYNSTRSIDISSLQTGIYYVNIVSDVDSQSIKLIKN